MASFDEPENKPEADRPERFEGPDENTFISALDLLREGAEIKGIENDRLSGDTTLGMDSQIMSTSIFAKATTALHNEAAEVGRLFSAKDRRAILANLPA